MSSSFCTTARALSSIASGRENGSEVNFSVSKQPLDLTDLINSLIEAWGEVAATLVCVGHYVVGHPEQAVGEGLELVEKTGHLIEMPLFVPWLLFDSFC